MRTLLTITVCAGAILASGCSTPVHDVSRAAFTTPAPVTMEQLAEAIWAGARREGWRTRDVSPGRTLVEKTVRVHRALTEITYDTMGFSLRLLEADNLDYDGTNIHKTYNLWVTQLEKSIQDEVRFRFR
jgi:hypothetical protein